MSDTPRTDIMASGNSNPCADEYADLLNFTRQLERELAAERKAHTWQPIETAPKDGTEILAWRRDCGILLVRWDAPENFLTDSECEKIGEGTDQYDWMYADFIAGGRLEGDEAPTHWMPLPSAPEVTP